MSLDLTNKNNMDGTLRSIPTREPNGDFDSEFYIFETEDFDIGGNYNTSNGIFTAPIAGIYHFMFRSLTATNTSVKCFHIGILSYNFCNRCIYDR